ncbi:MAG: TRL-like family protein [Treponema sp.]|nr:TRL-like family protein [Treponema sp.]
MKKILLIPALVVITFAGCASFTRNVNWYSSGDVAMEMRVEARNVVYFGLFGERSYPSAEQLARENGITRLATVERYWKLGVFGLWIEYITIVTGEGTAPVTEEL